VLLNIGWFYVAFAAFTIVGFSNAVNLTDGLDGLATVPVMMAAGAFGVISLPRRQLRLRPVSSGPPRAWRRRTGHLLRGHDRRGRGLPLVQRPAGQDLHGRHRFAGPGRRLGAIAVTTKHELVLGIVGGLFVMEAASVMIQVGYYKLTKKRIFLMAPIHHHFEKMGWPESTVVIRFWIIAGALALLGLSTLKLR
jgi:phospho-N-acetylmuramoyl-pentapeptide-transferase